LDEVVLEETNVLSNSASNDNKKAELISAFSAVIALSVFQALY